MKLQEEFEHEKSSARTEVLSQRSLQFLLCFRFNKILSIIYYMGFLKFYQIGIRNL